jgi:hypothetical protein
MESRAYMSTRDVTAVAADLDHWFSEQGMESQSVMGPGGSVVVQARDRQGWKSVLGMNRALTTTLSRTDDHTITANIGSASWADKAVAGAIGLVVLWPLAITAAVGSAQTAALPGRVFGALEGFTQSHSLTQPVPAGHPAVAHKLCPSCGQPADMGARFCQRCGGKLADEPAPCASCGAPLASGMHFCPACGAAAGDPDRTITASAN